MDETISAADANRQFSRLMRGVRAGRRFIVTSHGKPVAQIVPANEAGHIAAGAKQALLKRLRGQRATTVGKWSRDELYDDAP